MWCHDKILGQEYEGGGGGGGGEWSTRYPDGENPGFMVVEVDLISLVPRPSAALFLVAYVTFEPPSDKLAYLTGVQRSSMRLKTKRQTAWEQDLITVCSIFYI